MNPLFDDDIENELQKNIHDIKEQNNNVQTKLNHEQIEIEHQSCNKCIKIYVNEITKHKKKMEKKTQNENINNYNTFRYQTSSFNQTMESRSKTFTNIKP